MISCGPSGSKTEEKMVLNEGTTIVENGKGLNDTIPLNVLVVKRIYLLKFLKK